MTQTTPQIPNLEKSEKYLRFVAYLSTLERAAFAKVRRSLGGDASMEAIPYIERWTLGETAWRRGVYYLLAGLFCLVERPLEPGMSALEFGARADNLGASMGALYLSKERSGSVEKRFIALLDADEEQLPYRLRQMVTLLRSSDISIGWVQLLQDLMFWKTEKRLVQHRWARAFYQKSDPEFNAPSSDTPSNPEADPISGGN